MVEQNGNNYKPTVEEVTQLLRNESEKRKRTPWFADYDDSNLIPFLKLREIGLATYGEDWKSYLTTQTRDFTIDDQPIVDKNIAIGCLAVSTLDGNVGTLTHVLDSAEPLKVVKYLKTLHNNKTGVHVIITGGRDGISDELLATIIQGLIDEGFIIIATEVMGDRFGRITSLLGASRDVIVEKTDNKTKVKIYIPLSFDKERV